MKYILSCLLSFCSIWVTAQEETTVLDTAVGKGYVEVIAGDYDRSKAHGIIFGEHYRKEWSTPVRVKQLRLEDIGGGLKPYEAGGGRQSKSLKLHDKDNREYTLRSLDKSFGRALPPSYLGTFAEALVDDQVTIGHPYSAITIPSMAEAVKIYHAEPTIVYVPKQPLLDSFNENFGNRVYILEKRPDENWETAPEFGNAKNIISTDKMLDKLAKDNDNKVDQLLYARCRLFDWLIGDWGRHDDQWRWAEYKSDSGTLYKPIPRDRDQAYTLFDGILTGTVLHLADLDYLRSFKDYIKDIDKYNFTARHLDRRCAIEVTEEQWVAIAQDMQQLLTDDIIEKAVKQLPPEVYPISGPKIITHLKARRGHLQEWAREYYRYIARHVSIPGSKDNEYFEVRRVDKDNTMVNIYALDKEGMRKTQPVYQRNFKTDETRDIRLYGIGGNDVFDVEGETANGILIRIIGGDDRDSIIDKSRVHDLGNQTKVYDDRNNYFLKSREMGIHYGDDSATHAYDYPEFQYHKKGLQLGISYNNPDRFYFGIGYRFGRHRWRHYPFIFDQALYLRYSATQNAVSLLYDANFYQAIGKWNARLTAFQDFVRWTNFYGLGNETRNEAGNNQYYRLRTNEFQGSFGVNRAFNKHHLVDLTASFSAIEIINDSGQYVSDNYVPNQLYFFEHHRFVGARIGYTYQNVDDMVTPTKGVMLYGGAAYTQSIDKKDQGFATYNAIGQIYIPLAGKFSLSIRSGVNAVDGKPEFYQYASTGGSQTLRGYRRDRWWGKTTFYNSNELRWITDFRSYIMNGKFGIVAFFDDGRVWMPGENSTTLHTAFGGGIMLSPFNLASLSLTYGQSSEAGLIHVRLNRLLP